MNQTAWSLNGVWQVVTDDELQGRALHWERHSALLNRPDVRQVSIPCCLETCVEDFEGVAWFHRAFVHEGPTAPKVCPACLHPQGFFELLVENY